MTRLTIQRVLNDKQTTGVGDPNSVTSLSLTHKALSDVSCLSKFHNLERLDLAFNTLTSLEGLSSCVNLKWLSVVQNKLQSLKGVEGLSKLTVLNAGKNKIKSMEEVRSLVSLRALILNDNDIGSICRLDQMKDLNTLVLSRNPICEIGDCLVKVKSITKLSLSNCQLEAIGSSLKSCIELKELRLAHNDIKTLPAELVNNKKLQNLDLGNNVITRWSDVKVLSSSVNLKNLNLLGNPVADMDKLAKKAKSLLPNLLVFNAKPLVKGTKDPKNGELGAIENFLPAPASKQEVHKEGQEDHTTVKKKSSKHQIDLNEVGHLSESHGLHTGEDVKSDREKRKGKPSKIEDTSVGRKIETEDDKGHKRKRLLGEKPTSMANAEKDSKQSKNKTKDKVLRNGVLLREDDSINICKMPKGKIAKKYLGELDIVDDSEASFVDLVAFDAADFKHDSEERVVEKVTRDVNSLVGLVTSSTKKRKPKSQGVELAVEAPEVEIGMGGLSTWGDE